MNETADHFARRALGNAEHGACLAARKLASLQDGTRERGGGLRQAQIADYVRMKPGREIVEVEQPRHEGHLVEHHLAEPLLDTHVSTSLQLQVATLRRCLEIIEQRTFDISRARIVPSIRLL